MIEDAKIPFRPQILDVVAEADARRQNTAYDHEDNPDPDRHARPGHGNVDQLSGAEGVQIELWRFPRFLPLGEDDESREQEHHAEKKEQDAHAGQQAELSHAAEVGGQESEERPGRGDCQGRESGAGLGKLAVDQTSHAKSQEQAQRQRSAGIDDRGRAPEGIEEQRQHADHREEDVDDDVLANEVGIPHGDLVAARVRDLRQRRSRRRTLLEILECLGFQQRPFVQQRFSEGDVLRRPARLGQDQQHAVIRRHVVPAGGVHAEAAGYGLKLAKEDGDEIEGVVLNERLHGERLRSFQHGSVAGHGIADALIAKLGGYFVELRGRQKKERLRQDDLDEVERIGDLVRNVFDPGVLSIPLGDGIDERVVLMNIVALGHVHHHDVIVDRAEVFEDLAELIDLSVLLRNEVQQVGIERQLRRTADGKHHQQESGDEDLFVASEAEARERVEDSIGQLDSRGIVRFALRAGG